MAENKSAIITGDIVGSTKLDREWRTWVIDKLAKKLKSWDKHFDCTSELFRGDSFQTLVKNPSNALRIALIQRLYLRSLVAKAAKEVIAKAPKGVIDANMAIGIGLIDLEKQGLARSGGKAFQLSGHLLDTLKAKKQSLAIASDDLFQEELSVSITLLDAIIVKTTALQCEVLYHKLFGLTEVEIAKKVHVKQSAVNQRANAGCWYALELMLKRFEKMYTHEK